MDRDAKSKVHKKLRDITECAICLNTYIDPRILPCVHTFCLPCLREIRSESGKLSGEAVLCPICRKEFTVPTDGLEKLQKNFFMEKLMEIADATTSSTLEGDAAAATTRKNAPCDVCTKIKIEPGMRAPLASKLCVDCEENLCDDCAERHGAMKVSAGHAVVEIGSRSSRRVDETLRAERSKPRNCERHPAKALDYYCAECKRVVCVSCFVESHSAHRCSDVTTVSEAFRRAIASDVRRIASCVTLSVARTEHLKRKRDEFMDEMEGKELKILKRNQELKEMTDQHTRLLLDELAEIRRTHLRELEGETDSVETHVDVMESFRTYGSELASKGSPGDICSAVDEMHERTKELEKQNETLRSRSISSLDLDFAVSENFLTSNRTLNSVGKINVEELKSNGIERNLVVVGLYEGPGTMTNEVLKISLQRPDRVSALDAIPTEIQIAIASAVRDNVLYVTGVGKRANEIWRYDLIAKWSQCASLAQGRRRHCAAFVDDVLYVVGGFADADKTVLDGVEAYDAATDSCAPSGRLLHGVQMAACVVYDGRVYVFGGMDRDDKKVDHVQVYDAALATCALLSSPMPASYSHMRAVVWKKNFVFLLGCYTSFVFNLVSEAWEERKQFKTDVFYSGLVLENGKIFAVGGESHQTDKDGKKKWVFRDEIKYVPVANFVRNDPVEWKFHAKLPGPSLMFAYGGMKFPVD